MGGEGRARPGIWTWSKLPRTNSCSHCSYSKIPRAGELADIDLKRDKERQQLENSAAPFHCFIVFAIYTCRTYHLNNNKNNNNNNNWKTQYAYDLPHALPSPQCSLSPSPPPTPSLPLPTRLPNTIRTFFLRSRLLKIRKFRCCPHVLTCPHLSSSVLTCPLPVLICPYLSSSVLSCPHLSSLTTSRQQ